MNTKRGKMAYHNVRSVKQQILISACAFALLIFLTVIGAEPSSEKNIQLLTRTKAGLFSTFFSVLAHLTWCEKNDLTAYVYWGKDSNYYDKDSGQNTENVWEYYFEQLSDLDYNIIKDSDNVDIRKSYGSIDGFSIPYSENYELVLQDSFRKNMKRIIDKYIKVKPHTMATVEEFYKENIAGKTTFGIHIRGTDKFKELAAVSIEKICEQANECAKGLSNYQFFVATDQEALLTKAKQLLSGPVISYHSYRSIDGRAIHKKTRPYHSKYMLGEEVLIEVLLLARCNKFIHTRSNVSTAVLFFNPDLENFVLI
jgi:hypothetical protein